VGYSLANTMAGSTFPATDVRQRDNEDRADPIAIFSLLVTDAGRKSSTAEIHRSLPQVGHACELKLHGAELKITVSI
jgi:hypothetical protein